MQMYSSPRGGFSSAIHPNAFIKSHVPSKLMAPSASVPHPLQGYHAILGPHYLSWTQSCSRYFSIPSQPHWHAAPCCTTSACFRPLALIHSHIHPSPQLASLSCPLWGPSALPAVILKCCGSLSLSGSHTWHGRLKKPWLMFAEMLTGFCVVSPKHFTILFWQGAVWKRPPCGSQAQG